MALDYGMTNQEFEQYLDQAIDEKFVIDALKNFGLLPQSSFQLKNIEININNSFTDDSYVYRNSSIINKIKIDEDKLNNHSDFSIKIMTHISPNDKPMNKKLDVLAA